MLTSPGSHQILVAKQYDQAFFRHFASLLNEQMSKVKVLAKGEERRAFSLDRMNHSMKVDLPRMDYFVNGRRISVSNDIERSASNLGMKLEQHKCFWAIKYLEELSSILHQGIIKTIYDAKKLCKHSSWDPDLNLNLDILTHAADGEVLFCIYPEAKIFIGVSSHIANIFRSNGTVIKTNSLSSHFETVIYVRFISMKANDNGFRLVALPVMVGNSGYSMKLNLEGVIG